MKIKDIKNVLKFFHDGDQEVLIDSEVSSVKYHLWFREDFAVKLEAITENFGTFKLGEFEFWELIGNLYSALKTIEDAEKHLMKNKEYFITASYKKKGEF